jgi:hypothetical protein
MAFYARRYSYRADNQCTCGSGMAARAVYDARQIFVAFVCDGCQRSKLAQYRPEIFTDPNYEHSEPIDEE